MMRPESAIHFSSKNFPVSQFLGDFQTKGRSDFAVCGVQIEIVCELCGFPCVTFQSLSLFT